MRLVFARQAKLDLDSIIDYIALEDPAAAEEAFDAIVDTAKRLTEFPDMGRAGRLPGTREFPVASLPNLIVYEVRDETVTVLAVFHGSRDLARALAERNSELKK